jgi:amino acid transporter
VTAEPQPHLERRFGLLQATALNMSNMIGIGPFITIPILMSTIGGGPQAMLGWIVAVLIVIPDGMIWAELGAAIPGSGGTYTFLREGYGRQTWGRLMAFLFIWQFILSGPLEIASGYIGFQHYASYLFPGMSRTAAVLLMIGVGALNIFVLYRRIGSIGKITVAIWSGVLLTVVAVIVTGAFNFNAKRAFDFPPNAFQFSLGFMMGLGAAARIGIYDYLGYYDICYIGDEVRNPGRVIPLSIFFSILAVAAIYFSMNLSLVGVVPWREFVPADQHPEAKFIFSHFMEKVHGSTVASLFTAMIMWTAFGSCFALLLGYSRIPFAAAQDGSFFKVFGSLHPKKNFPHVSLLVVGGIAIVCSFFALDVVIEILLTTRILVQFIGQIGAVMLLRKHRPHLARPYRIYLYPVPAFVALVGWMYLFVTSGGKTIGIGLGTLVAGMGAFLVWSRVNRTWPFRSGDPSGPGGGNQDLERP